MAAKRLLDESGSDPDQQNQKRTRTIPSFISVIREVMAVNFLENVSSALEPMLRRVVNEEVENGLRRNTRSLARSPSLRIQAIEPSSLKLIFSKTLSLPIFTGTKIFDIEKNPLIILLVDTRGNQMLPSTLSFPIKVEIVVLDGDFPPGDSQTWTSDEFDKNIVKERAGKRPLLNGELPVTMRDGFASVGEIEFTDNSSWIRSRRFRLGARLVQGTNQGVIVREAMTESFMVKDHRGELYKKHHPPRLEDEVWRLKKIGKDGVFHKKLAAEGINTVQDFLKLSNVYPSKLRKILGVGMSDKSWEVTLKHAKTCIMDRKMYIFRRPNYMVFLNPICEVVKALINGQVFHTIDLINMLNIETLVRHAYANWNSLEEDDGLVKDTGLLTQGDVFDQYPNQHQITTVRSYQQNGFLTTVGTVQSNEQAECSHQCVHGDSAYLGPPVESGACYNFSEASTDDEFAPPKSFFQ